MSDVLRRPTHATSLDMSVKRNTCGAFTVVIVQDFKFLNNSKDAWRMSFIVVSKPFNDTDGFKALWTILLVIFGEVVFIWLWWEVAFFSLCSLNGQMLPNLQ